MSYRPTGPELLSGRAMSEIVARVVGHRVMAVRLPFWMFRKVARQQRIDPLEISGFRYYMEEMKRGAFATDGGVTDVVENLTGTPAESFETTARRYAAMPFARQTLANRLRAFARFNVTPFYAGYDLDRWAPAEGLSDADPPQSVDRGRSLARGAAPANDAANPVALRAR